MRGFRGILTVAAAVAVGLVAVFGAAWLLKPSARVRSISVYCGNSMRPAAEEIAAEYQKRAHVLVQFTYGGAEALFPQIKLARKGDIFICHDPFGPELQKEGLVSRSITVGYLDPILVVQPGNPRKIRGLADLVKSKLRVGVTDPRYATCGKMVEDRLRERKWARSFNDNENFVLQTRSHGDVAAAMVAGQLDAGVVWNFVAQQFRDKMDSVPTGESFPETHVTVCLLSCADQPESAGGFLDLAASEFGKRVFAQKGYTRNAVAQAKGSAHGG